MTTSPSLRIGLVTPWASRAGGGVFEAVAAHCDMLRAIGFEPVVIALQGEGDMQDRHRFGDAQVFTAPRLGPPIVGFAPSMTRTIIEARPDLIHLHGIWMHTSASASRAARALGVPYVVSPHGMLDKWILSRGKWKKALARLGYERASWRQASAFHALTGDEAQDIRDETGRSDSAIIPNAIELAPGGTDRAPTLAYLGRIHPKKNLTALIEGWRLARDMLAPLGARLEIAGWGDEDHVAQLKAALARDGGADIAFVGPLFGADKAAFIGSARYVALPSHSEGLPMAILEAWAAGTPTLMSRHCHLPEGYAAGAAIDCGTQPEEIAAALRLAFGKTAENWHQMSQAGQDLVRRQFTPEVVAGAWKALYTRLLDAPA